MIIVDLLQSIAIVLIGLAVVGHIWTHLSTGSMHYLIGGDDKRDRQPGSDDE